MVAVCETVAFDISDIFGFALLVGEIFKSSKMQKTSMSSAWDFHAQVAYWDHCGS